MVSGKVPNYKMLTFQKVINDIGISKDKEILNMQIEDLGKIKNFQKRDLKRDLKNIIELRQKIKEGGIIAYLRETNDEYEKREKYGKEANLDGK